MPGPSYDPAELADRKRKSRDQDARDLATGRKTVEVLKQENGLFSKVPSRPRWDKSKPLR